MLLKKNIMQLRFMILTFVLLLSVSLKAAEVEKIMSSVLNEGMDKMFLEDFSAAEKKFEEIVKSYPDYPLGYFALGTLYNFMMDHYETEQFDDKISKLYLKVENISLKLLEENEKDPWLLFYAGAAKSNTGFTLGRNGNYLSALNNTFSGISFIEDCLEEDPELNDAKMLLGSYMYYKSSITHWIYDNREKGIEMIKESIQNSYFAKYISIAGLTWIYIDYDEYDKALEIVEKGLKSYPDSRYFLWGKVAAYFDKGNFEKSNELLFRIKEMVSKDKIQTNRNKFNCCYRLAIGFKELGEKEKSLKFIEEANSYNLSEVSKEKLESRIDKLEDLQEELLELE